MQPIFLMIPMEPIFLLGFVAVLYFFMLRPQAQKQKEQKKFTDNISVGDKIVTIGGIHGKISKRNEDGTYTMEGERNSYFIIEASAVSMEMTAAYRKKTEAVTSTK
jgi:preprotein translocase subunit YajC